MPRRVTRTVYGASAQVARAMGLNHDIPNTFAAILLGGVPTAGKGALNSTAIPHLPSNLVAGMQTAPEYDPEDDTDGLRVNIFCIGSGGHRYVPATADTPAYTTPIPHRSTDVGMYRWMPFIVKDLSTGDITGTERAKYRLRRTLEIGGQLYAAYYGKVIDYTGVEPEVVQVSYDGGQPTSVPFTPTVNNQKPVAPSTTVVNENNNTYVASSATLTIPFTAQDVANLMEAVELVHGDVNYAVISEVAICHGVDKPCNIQYANITPFESSDITSNNPTEAVGVQPVTYFATHYPVVYVNDGFNITTNMGATEPLFGVGT